MDVIKKIFQKPVLNESEPNGEHKVSWLELFFDLFFTVVIFEIVHAFADDFSSRGLITFIFSFTAAWWIWVEYVNFNERFSSKGLGRRAASFILMIPVAGMAAFAEHALDENFIFFLSSYFLSKIVMLGFWIWGGYHNKKFRPVMKQFIIADLLSFIFFGLSFILPEPIQHYGFYLGLTINLISPFLSIPYQSSYLLKPNLERLSERHGLFVLIVLGETIRGIIDASSFSGEGIFTGIYLGTLGIAVAFCIWSIYFDYTSRKKIVESVVLSHFWSYLHLPLTVSLGLFGACLLAISETTFDLSMIPPEVGVILIGSLGSLIFLLSIIDSTLVQEGSERQEFSITEVIRTGSGLLLMIIGSIIWGAQITTSLEVIIVILLSNLLVNLFVVNLSDV